MGEAADLLGRTAELDQLTALVASISDGGAAQLILGEPGAGKTALLEAASKRAVAADITVLGTVGVEFAVVERFDTLGALLRPLHRRAGPAHRGGAKRTLCRSGTAAGDPTTGSGRLRCGSGPDPPSRGAAAVTDHR